mgnify:CR=1 FL=1
MHDYIRATLILPFINSFLSFLETLSHMLNGSIGCGVLGMGMAFRNGGLVFSSFLVMVVAFIAVYNQHLLVSKAGCVQIESCRSFSRIWFALRLCWPRKINVNIICIAWQLWTPLVSYLTRVLWCIEDSQILSGKIRPKFAYCKSLSLILCINLLQENHFRSIIYQPVRMLLRVSSFLVRNVPTRQYLVPQQWNSIGRILHDNFCSSFLPSS